MFISLIGLNLEGHLGLRSDNLSLPQTYIRAGAVLKKDVNCNVVYFIKVRSKLVLVGFEL